MAHLERSCSKGSPGEYGDPLMADIGGIDLWMLGWVGGGSHEQSAEGGRGGIFCDKGTAGEKWTRMELLKISHEFYLERLNEREREKREEGGSLSLSTNVRGNHSAVLSHCKPPGSSVCGDSPGKNTEVGCHAFFQGIFSNPGLPHCRQILYHLSPQGSPRMLEWVAYPFSRKSSRPRN